MGLDFKTLLGVAFDKNQAQSELDRQIKSLQKNSKLALNIEVSDKQAKKIIQDQSNAWKNYRKEAVAAISAPNTDLQKMGQYYKNLEKQSDSYLKKNTNGIDAEIKKRSEQSRIFSNQIKSQMQERLSAENKIQNELKQTAKLSQDGLNLKSGKIQLSNNIESYLKNNTKLSKDLQTQLINIQSRIKGVDKTQLKNLKNEFREVTSAANMLGQNGDNFATRLVKNSKQLLNFLGSATIIMGSVNAIRNMIADVTELNKATISLKKVTNETDITYEKFLNNAAQKAKNLGASISDIVNMTAEWAKAGYNLSDSTMLAEVSTVFTNVGDVDTATAVSDIVTPLKAFNLAASDAIKIVDKLNEVDNNFAVNSADIGTGLANSASALALAGNDINQSIALITGGSEITQNASETGNAVKVLSMRLRGMKGELQAIGEEYENIDSVSKIQTQIYNLTKGSVNIMDDLDPTKFKSTYEIMKQISKVWSDISQTDQAALLETIAGKQRGNQIAAILSAFQSGQVDKAYETAITSQNSALNEQEKYMKGIEYSSDRLVASMQELSATTLDSSTVKWFVDFANGAVNATNAMGGLIPVLTTAGIVYGITKIAMDALLVSTEKKTISNLAATVSEYGLATSIKATGAAMKSFLLTNPVGWAILAAGAVFSLSKVYDLFNTSLKEQLEIIDNSKKKYEDSTNELSTLNTELQTTRDRINELNALPNLTFTEQSELETLQKTNDELERSIELKKIQQNIDLQSSITDISDGYDKYSKKYGDMSSYKANTGTINDYINQAKIDETTASSWASGDDLDKYIAEKEKQITSWNGDINNLKSDYLTYASKLEDWIKQFETLGVDNLTTSQKGVYDSLKSDLDNIYKNVLSSTEYKKIVLEPKFDIAFNNTSFSKAKAQLEDLAKSGKLTPDVISSNKEYAKLLSNTGLSAQEVANQINALVVVSDDITESTVDATEATQAFNDALTALSSSDKALSDIKTEVEEFGAISMGTINSLMDKYPQLTDVLYDYLSGVSSTKDVINALSSVYETDMQNWQSLLLNKYENNEEFLKQVGGNNSDLINTMMSQYSIDISNNRSYLETKMDILNTYLGQAGGAWLKYYDIASGKTQNLGGLSAGDQYYISKQATLANEALATFNQGLDFSGITSTFETANGDFKTGKADEAEKAATEAEKKRQEAIQKVKDDFAKEDDANKFLVDTGKMKEATYYEKLNDLNKKYFKGKADFLAEDRQNQVAYYNWLENQEKDSIKSKFDANENTFNLSDKAAKDEEKYYAELARLNDLYYKGNLEYADEYQDNLEKLHDHEVELAEDAADKKVKANEDYIDSVISKFEKAQSDIDDIASNTEDGSTEQFSALTKGLESATNEAKYLESQITKLNKKYKNDKSNEDYISQLEDLTSKLGDAKDAMKSYQDSMVDNIKARYEEQKDAMTDAYDDEKEAIEDRYDTELDRLNEIVDAKKKSLQADKDAADYAKDIAEKTKDIADIDKRKIDLTKAANSGDREAIAELKELEEDRAKAQEELDDAQADHKLDVETDALDNLADNFEKQSEINKATDLASAKSIFDTKLANLTTLYKKEEELITQVSEYTKSAFTTALADVNSQITKLTGSASSTGSIDASSLYDNLTGINSNNTTSSTDSAILSILSNGKGTGAGTSKLNEYIKSNYNGSQLSYAQMASLASLLGMSGVSSKSIVGDSDTKDEILKKLKSAGFSSGGYVNAKSVGEDGFALVKHGEPILTVEQGKMFKELVGNLQPLNNLVKLSTPNLSNIVTNNNSAPIALAINVTGVNDKSLLANINSAGNDLLKNLSSEIRKLK